MRAASEMSTSGTTRGGGVCERTTASCVSTVSLEWQQGHATSIASPDFFTMLVFYASGSETGSRLSVNSASIAKSCYVLHYGLRRLRMPLHGPRIHDFLSQRFGGRA